MPFKSEKQKRYLWANEPEIARDWTDTYGSRIKKNSGGISQLVKSGPGRPGYRGDAGYRSGSEQASSIGQGNVGSQASFGGGQGQDSSGKSEGAAGADSSYVKRAQQASHEKVVAEAKRIVELKKKAKKKKKASLPFWKGAAYGLTTNKKKVAAIRNQYRDYLKSKGVTNIPTTLDDENLYSFYESDAFNYDPIAPGKTETFEEKDFPGTLHQKTSFDKPMNYGDWMAEYQGSPGIKHSGNLGEVGEKYVKTRDEVTGKPLTYGYHEKRGDGQGGGYMGYPSYAAWQAAQGGGGGGGTTTATTAASTPSAFQQSLTTGTTGVSSPFDYYVGQDPTAKNLAWGEKFGVDPRTMYKTSWAADGGRIGRAYGGIMDSSTGRRAYGFGSIFSKIGKAAKKVLKSPIGKAALVAGGFGLAGMGPFKGLQGTSLGTTVGGWFGKQGPLAGLVRKKLADTATTGIWGAPSWAKIGIGAAGALPFFMGGEEEDEDEGFDYEGAKNKYWDEIMRIKSGAMAGSLDPTKFNYLGVKDGGRIGLYAGGQSTPSDYTMEDAMMTTTQDKLGGITDVMKQADLSRQGSVGQFYAAHGGSADDNNARLEARVKELQDEGLSWDAAWAQAHNELRDKNAHGGRIGYDEGGPAEIGGDNISEILKRVQELEDEGLDFGAAMAQAMRELSQGKAHGGRIGYADAGKVWGMDKAQAAWNKLGTNSKLGYVDFVDFFLNGQWGSNQYRTGSDKLAEGGRIGAEEGGLMDLGGMEKDYRNDGGFVPLGGEEKADDVPARLSKNEFVFTADAVRGAGEGDIDKGAEIMENIMKNLEQGGKISEETQGNTGAQGMFDVSERLGEVL